MGPVYLYGMPPFLGIMSAKDISLQVSESPSEGISLWNLIRSPLKDLVLDVKKQFSSKSYTLEIFNTYSKYEQSIRSQYGLPPIKKNHLLDRYFAEVACISFLESHLKRFSVANPPSLGGKGPESHLYSWYKAPHRASSAIQRIFERNYLTAEQIPEFFLMITQKLFPGTGGGFGEYYTPTRVSAQLTKEIGDLKSIIQNKQTLL